ncbi:MULTISPECIES: cyclin-dependent kinase inhibitor 3 family protein [unclassified Thioalkalivibrio]|uniref:cyclin-dependent kinase inhibitor 3 family protein n=1 Tax=unclassified Thioalkalivibrio TaxID=2621013 RepID=UPI000380E298|nr:MULTISPECIES: cyclin-dependent kinase inhibitor 3 family protein [unclassified Thioalkalivibrio]
MTQTDDTPASPLEIGTVRLPEGGTIGMTPCPGKCEPGAPGGQRDLVADLAAIRSWGATAVVTLNQGHELDALGVPELGDAVHAAGMEWLHLPIGDMAAPDRPWELRWGEVGPEVHRRLDAGEGVIFHCGGGFGRAGTIAALALIERGLAPEEAIGSVRGARPGAIESPDQQRYLLGPSGNRA